MSDKERSSRSSASGREDRHRSRDDDRSSERKRDRDHDRDRDRDHHSRHRSKRDSSSEDERDKKRRKHHKKDKRDKKEKRDRKEKEKKKDRKSSSSSSSKKDEKRRELEEQAKAFLQKNASMGEATAVLTDSDYFARHAEFSLWLKEAKGLFFEDLSAAKSRKKFSKFVDLWNRGSLPDKFYKGISTQDLEHNTRTGYQWGFTNRIDEKEALTLSSMRDEISRETNRPKGARPPPRRPASTTMAAPSPSTRGPSGPAVKHPDDEELDDEDKRRYDRLMRKKQEKSAQGYREAVMEELVPKADPGSREARLEKQKQKGAYAKGREDSPEINESDLMGGGDSFKDRLRRQQEWRSKKDSARSEEAQKKLAAHQAKEDAVMQQFRTLLAQRGPPQL